MCSFKIHLSPVCTPDNNYHVAALLRSRISANYLNYIHDRTICLHDSVDAEIKEKSTTLSKKPRTFHSKRDGEK